MFAQKQSAFCSKTTARLTLTNEDIIPESYDDFDMKYVFLDLKATNQKTYIEGTATLIIEIIADETSIIELELVNELTVSQVLIDEIVVNFEHANDLLTINSSEIMYAGEVKTLKIDYSGEPNPASSGIFTGINNKSDNTWKNQVTWTLAEPFNAKYFWPAKQELTDKIDSSRVYITTDKSLKAGSNGLLKNVIAIDQNTVRYEWVSSYDIAYYLIAFSVSDYVEYNNYAHPDYLNGDSIFIQNYIYSNPETLPHYKERLDEMPRLIEVFSDYFGPYPFDREKYGHMMAPIGGGMEHQTMSTMHLFAFSLDAHELAHQWFGDQVTCGTWRDIWINEGFARFGEYLATEKILSETNARTYIQSDINDVLRSEDGSVYIGEEEELENSRIFNYKLTYQKGGLIINMIRHILYDDEEFFTILRAFQNRFAHSTATGEDFKMVLEEISGKDFESFFEEWYYGEGYPTFDIRWSKFPADSLTITINQTTSASTPLFTTPLELYLTYESGIIKRIVLQQSQNEETFVLPANGKIQKLEFDKDNWLIKKVAAFREVDAEGKVITKANNLEMPLLYPNPARDQIQFNQSVKHLAIYNTSGQLVLQKGQITAGQIIEIGSLNPGLYFVKVDGEKALKLIVR